MERTREPMYVTESHVQAGTRLAGDLPAGGTDAIHSVNLALERMAQVVERAQTQMCAALEGQSLQIGRLATTLADGSRGRPRSKRQENAGTEGRTMPDYMRYDVVVDAKIKPKVMSNY